MYIKDIILDGFKIYENKTVIRNLTKSYNAITGLNGSGKSNIIDGIIFALGLESRKLLRANSLKELINVHRSDCKVTLILSNTDKSKSPVGYKDFNEIVISRSIDSLGKTKFYINNHVCSATTINKLCASMNINAEKGEFFFIIMQGHITKVLNMKSKEIGNLIEETAGTRSYVKEKEKALLVLEKKESKLIEVRDILQKRISPFYSRLREEREAYLEQKNLDQLKKDAINEQQEIKKDLLVNEVSKNINILKNLIETFVTEKKQLMHLESKIAELQVFDSEDNAIAIKELLDEEKFKLDEIKKNNFLNKINKLKEQLNKLKIPKKSLNLQELKAKEAFLQKSFKNEVGIGGKDFEILEELENLKILKTKLEYKCQSYKNLNLQDIDNKLNNIEKLRVNLEELNSKKTRLNYLKTKINYPIKTGIYGTIDENFTIFDEKYKEAIYTVMGAKSKHIIVENENIGSELLNCSDRRISVIPLNKIRSKIVSKNVIDSVKEVDGLHMIDLLKFDVKLKKAMEHVFNGFFVFENKDIAKKICYKYKVMCITLDGSVYDPKGTLTGGKVIYKNEIISRLEILSLLNEIKKEEQNIQTFDKLKEEYEQLKVNKNKCAEKEKILEDLDHVSVKIRTITDLKNNTVDVRKDLSEVRKNIIDAIQEENIEKEIEDKKNKILIEISNLEKKQKENEDLHEDSVNKILKLQDKLGELEIKTSNKRLSERQVEGLEPKQKHLIRSTSKVKNRIFKISSEIEDMLTTLVEQHNNAVSNNSSVQLFTDEEDYRIFKSLEINEDVFKFLQCEISDEEHKKKLDRLSELNAILEKCAAKRTVRMDPSNFDLLEKNELLIQSLKDKIKQLESDKHAILSSISSFDLLGVKENEKAFRHLNEKIGIFLRYFFQDSNVKIDKVGAIDYELKVKIGNWKESLAELSGGQRSLVALCIIFSILTYRPAPFYIFDEIDSALDLSYTQNIGEIIKKEFCSSQFIIISLKNGMYENADNVYKVFLKDGKSNICQIK